MISARIVEHSINPAGSELITLELTYPRMIHAEFMTHRAFSRNAASSRAIPTEKMLEAVESNPAMPEYWGANQSGMQARQEVSPTMKFTAQFLWRHFARIAAQWARSLHSCGLHKQIANRVLECFGHITVLVTTTRPGLVHYFGLRAHEDAQPEFQKLAFLALDAFRKSTPKQLQWGEWHMPYGDRAPLALPIEERLKIATARCARLSYLTHDGEIDFRKDLGLYDRLKSSDPAHASAFEHCGKADPDVPRWMYSNFDIGFDGFSSSWLQYRKTLHNEFNGRLDLDEIMARKPDWIELPKDEMQLANAA